MLLGLIVLSFLYHHPLSAQFYAKPEYDGVYIVNGAKYVMLKQSPVIFGRFGRCMGGYSDFNFFRTYFIASVEGCPSVPATVTKLLVTDGTVFSSGGTVYFSELHDFSKDYKMCVWNLNTDQEHSFAGNKLAYTPWVTS